MVPARVPTAAALANATPWLSARKKAIGPEVSGSPTSQPLTAGPQRRPVRLAAPISAGVSTNFRARLSICQFSHSPYKYSMQARGSHPFEELCWDAVDGIAAAQHSFLYYCNEL